MVLVSDACYLSPFEHENHEVVGVHSLAQRPQDRSQGPRVAKRFALNLGVGKTAGLLMRPMPKTIENYVCEAASWARKQICRRSSRRLLPAPTNQGTANVARNQRSSAQS
eukprot:CAMPEP_0172709826 /NCGR_PEP_ID=MMETSP1074-20121228/55298_1 /TAXON_ID=2916 /ORGANISM="Ceratium fusus, Strain PA161109" /LENGTH=109 /DNA_ID=CAMNT_0013533139 /DNA_START=289 /DNA_END=614 /DNA_ORIENTATION=-